MSRRRRPGWLVVLVVAVAVAMGCSSEPSTPEVVAPTAPERHPPVGPGPPGEVLDAEELDEPTVDGTVWRVRYRSTGLDGEPIGVTGLVARPDGPPPAGGFPVLSWAHGTTGVADACAPSLNGVAGVPGLPEMLAAGYVVAATDYPGLGSEGVHPYLVSVSEGRGVLDAARAAREVVPETSAQVVVFGASQGGHAALAAAELAEAWAPELDVLGTVAAAPAADLEQIARRAFEPGVDFGFAALIVAGWTGVYDDLSADDVLGPEGRRIAQLAVDSACVTEVFGASAEADPDDLDDLVTARPLELDAWRRRISENTIDPAQVRGPVLLVQGTADDIIPQSATDRLRTGLCDAGVRVQYSVHDGAGHGEATLRALPEIQRWAAARVAGEPAPTTCP